MEPRLRASSLRICGGQPGQQLRAGQVIPQPPAGSRPSLACCRTTVAGAGAFQGARHSSFGAAYQADWPPCCSECASSCQHSSRAGVEHRQGSSAAESSAAGASGEHGRAASSRGHSPRGEAPSKSLPGTIAAAGCCCASGVANALVTGGEWRPAHPPPHELDPRPRATDVT